MYFPSSGVDPKSYVDGGRGVDADAWELPRERAWIA